VGIGPYLQSPVIAAVVTAVPAIVTLIAALIPPIRKWLGKRACGQVRPQG
jgi:hypothetical protein